MHPTHRTHPVCGTPLTYPIVKMPPTHQMHPIYLSTLNNHSQPMDHIQHQNLIITNPIPLLNYTIDLMHLTPINAFITLCNLHSQLTL